MIKKFAKNFISGIGQRFSGIFNSINSFSKLKMFQGQEYYK